MKFEKFAKLVNDRARSLKIPELQDQRGFLQKFVDYFRGNTNIQSILENVFQNIEPQENKQIFLKLLEAGKIGDDEMQYLVLKIIEAKLQDQAKESNELPPPETIDKEKEEEFTAESFKVDLPKHFEKVREIIADFIINFDSNKKPVEHPSSADLEKALSDEEGETLSEQTNPESLEAAINKIISENSMENAKDIIEKFKTNDMLTLDETMCQEITKALEEINYFQDGEDYDKHYDVVSVYYREYFIDGQKIDKLFHIRLSYALANYPDLKLLYETLKENNEGTSTVLGSGAGEILKTIIKQNIKAKVDLRKIDEKYHQTAKDVEEYLEDLLEGVQEALLKDKKTTNENIFGRYTAGGAKKAFVKKLSGKIWQIISRNEQQSFYNFKKNSSTQDAEIDKIKNTIANILNNMDENKQKTIIQFYKISFGKKTDSKLGYGLTPKLFGNVVANITRYVFNPEKTAHRKEVSNADSSDQQNVEEQLTKLIKPLIKEKLKRKLNG